jgi:hypothetical protein
VVETVEHGDIQFWFRPMVQAAHAAEYKLGVQSLFAVLSPAGGRIHRRLRIGKKRMPSRSRDRFWARVERVGSLQRVLGDLLEAERYATKTRGERYQPAARAVAAGEYGFVRSDDHLHLSYRVDREHADDVHDDDAVRPSESNDDVPYVDSASHLVLFKSARGTRVWSTTGEPSRLDTERAQIVLVGARPALELSVSASAASPTGARPPQ